MGNILNIIDSRNDFKKMDGLLPLQCGPFFNFEFDNYFEYKFHNLKYISKANNYFYIVEIAHDFGITDAINDILKMNKLIKLINNDKCKVILGYESEGDIDMTEYNDWYLEFCKPLENKIKFSNFYIFNADLNCQKNNKTKINFFSGKVPPYFCFAKIIPKQSQKHPNIIPKSSQNHTKIIPT